MGLFKKRGLKKRVLALEDYLGLAYAQDSYGDYEYFEKRWGDLVELKRNVEELKGKKK